MRHYTLASFREILLAGPKYADFSSKIHHLSELTDIPFISLGQNTGTREMHINYFLQHDLPFYPDIEAATADQILPMIRHNLGIGFYPEALAEEAIKRRSGTAPPHLKNAGTRNLPDLGQKPAKKHCRPQAYECFADGKHVNYRKYVYQM